MSEGLSCFVLVYCLLVPMVGIIASIILLNTINEVLAIVITACLYLSSAVLGALHIRRFREHRDRVEFWTLAICLALSVLGCLAIVAMLIFLAAAVKLRIIS